MITMKNFSESCWFTELTSIISEGGKGGGEILTIKAIPCASGGKSVGGAEEVQFLLVNVVLAIMIINILADLQIEHLAFPSAYAVDGAFRKKVNSCSLVQRNALELN